MTINISLMRKVLEHITAHPEQVNQETWGTRQEGTGRGCGTTHCFAGWTVVLSHHRPLWMESESDDHGLFHMDYVRLRDSYEVRAVGAVAAAELGLTEMEADVMFNECETITSLWEMAEHFTDGKIAVPTELVRP